MQSKNKKIIGAVCLLFLIMVVVIIYLSQSSAVSIEYSIDISKHEFYPNTVNEINIICVNRGERSGSFYVVLNAKNATLNIKENEGLSHLNENSVWIPFSLNGGASESKSVKFTVDKSQLGFSFSVTLQESENNGIIAGNSPISSISYRWNNSTERYEPAAGGGVVA